MTAFAPAFTAWLDDFFSSYYRNRPVNATFIGIHSHDHYLPDYSQQGADNTVREMEGLLARLRELPSEPLTEAQKLDRRLAEGFLKIQLWEYRSRHFHRDNPCVYSGEAVFGIIALFLRPFAPLAQRVEAAITRMARIPTLLNQGRVNVREAPLAWTQRAITECVGALNFLNEGISLLIQENNLAHTMLRTYADKARDAFVEFKQYLESELVHHTNEEYACGREAFELLLREGHFLDSDASAIEASAQKQLAEAQTYIETHVSDFSSGRADEHPTAEQYYARFHETWQAVRSGATAHKLLTWPDYPIRYVPQPVWARTAAPYLYFLAYRAPPCFDQLPIIEYLVPPVESNMTPDEQNRILRTMNDSAIKLNHCVHHGGLGHHVQNWYAYRAASRIGQIAAVDCASRIAMNCGGTMAEGWAGYTTRLMDEIGFLTPSEHNSQYRGRMRLAARSIVDVKLHNGNFTLDQAVAFYHDRVGMTPEAAQKEAVKNSMFPTMALMYMVGRNLIDELRKDLTEYYGSAFNLYQFHNNFLSYGSVPVSLIGAAMREKAAQS